MAWATVSTSDALTLSTSYADVQQSAATMVVGLNPREIAQVQLDVDSNGTTDDVDWAIVSSPDDGTTYDSDETPLLSGRIEVTSSSVDQKLTVQVMGVEQFKIRAKKTGSTDTITLTARVRQDGVSA